MDTDTPQENKKKLYVGNLPWSMTEEDLRELCEPYGEIVEVSLITDRQTGRSSGFGFVEYTDEEAAEKAIEALHENEVGGRNLFVKIARPKRPRTFDGDRRGGFGHRGGNRSGGRRDDRFGRGRGDDRQARGDRY